MPTKKCRSMWSRESRYSAKTTLYLSLIIIFIFPIIINSINIFYSYIIFKKEITQKNEMLLLQLRDNMDTNLDILAANMDSISMLSSVNQLNTNGYPSVKRNTLETYHLKQELGYLAFINPVIKEIAIYFPDSRYIVTSDNVFKRELLASGMLRNESVKDINWTTIEKSATYKPDLLFFYESNCLVYVKILTISNKTASSYIAITLDNKYLDTSLRNSLSHDNALIMLTTSSDVLLSTDISMQFKQEDLEYSAFPTTSLASNQESYTLLSKPSESAHFQYVYAIPTNLYSQNIKGLLTLALGCFVVSTGLGFVFIRNFFWLNYSPIKKILTIFTNSQEKIPENEFSFIQNEISKRNIQIADQKDTLVNSLLIKSLLLKATTSEIHQLELLTKYSSGTELICVLALLKNKNHALDGIDNTTLAPFVLENVLHEIFSTSFSGFAVTTGQYVALVLKVDATKNIAIKETCFSLAEQSVAILFDELKMVVAIASSQAVHSLEELHIAYNHAKDALDTIVFFNSSFYAHASKYASLRNNYEYDITIEVKIINTILSGDEAAAKALVHESIAKNLVPYKSSVADTSSFLHDFYGTLIKINHKMKENYTVFSENELFDITYLYAQKQLFKILEYIDDHISKICTLMQSNQLNPFLEICREITQYIDTNFHNKDLNISLLADIFRFSPIYLSRNFTALMGTTILDYIVKVRIAEAKTLLMQGYKVFEIADKTGFSSPNSFIRTFKKMEGITPGNYKEI